MKRKWRNKNYKRPIKNNVQAIRTPRTKQAPKNTNSYYYLNSFIISVHKFKL